MVTMEVFVAAFSALAVLFAGAFYWILSEFRSVRKDIQAVRDQDLESNRALREDFKEDNRVLREDFKEEMRALREEFREDNRALREEFKGEIRTLREEFREDNRALREEMRDNTQRILEAIYFHRHDPNAGEAVFYPPTQIPPAAD